MLASYLYYVKGNTKLKRQNYTFKNNPLGLVFQIGLISANSQAIIARLAGSPEMLTFAYARARSVLGLIIHQLNLYHND